MSAPPPHLRFRLLPDRLAICRLEKTAAAPAWADAAPFSAMTRTPDELSIVCAEAAVPAGVLSVRGRRALGIEGVIDFATVGLIAGLSAPLAAAGVSIFVVSTYDTDWILVREDDLDAARRVLERLGHEVVVTIAR